MMSDFYRQKDKMKCHSKEKTLSVLRCCKAFSLIETVTALVILAFVSSSVLVVINRCMASAADSALRMQAFEVARENMETLLASDSVKEMAEYGSSDKYPAIQWQSVVEAFYEPLTVRMWVRAVCSAEYTDTAGNAQTVELTHWLTDLTRQQVIGILEEKQREKERLAEEALAEQQEQTEEAEQQGEEDEQAEPEEPKPEEPKPEEPKPEEPKPEEPKPEEELICGYTMEELNQMDFSQLLEALSHCF